MQKYTSFTCRNTPPFHVENHLLSCRDPNLLCRNTPPIYVGIHPLYPVENHPLLVIFCQRCCRCTTFAYPFAHFLFITRITLTSYNSDVHKKIINIFRKKIQKLSCRKSPPPFPYLQRFFRDHGKYASTFAIRQVYML